MERMPDLPMKSVPAPKPVVRKPRTTSTYRRVKQPVKGNKTGRPVKKLPAYRLPCESQPRDRFGRFARKTGAVLLAGAKATGKAVVSTAKGLKKARKTIKRIRVAARRQANLQKRERKKIERKSKR